MEPIKICNDGMWWQSRNRKLYSVSWKQCKCNANSKNLCFNFFLYCKNQFFSKPTKINFCYIYRFSFVQKNLMVLTSKQTNAVMKSMSQAIRFKLNLYKKFKYLVKMFTSNACWTLMRLVSVDPWCLSEHVTFLK